jgi:hypothetical protein
MLTIGVFAPVIRMPIVGGVSLIQGTSGYVLLGAALLSLMVALANRLKVLWSTGAVSLGVVLHVVYKFHSMKSEMTTRSDKDLEDNPFGGLFDLAVQFIQLEWGCPVLAIGACLLLVAAGWKNPVLQPALAAEPGGTEP